MPKKPNSSSDVWPFFTFATSINKIDSIFEERPNLRHQLKPLNSVKSAALVSGLLTNPDLHANTIRIELLVHILLTYSRGKRKLKERQLDSWLNRELSNSMFAHWEDPVEDVFLSNVITEDGNFRIFEGTWENSAFYLQRILNVVRTLPHDSNTQQLRREILAIIKLSEEIATRRKIIRFTMGGGQAKRLIKIPSWDKLKSLRSSISFTSADLERLGIDPADLAPFVFSMSLRSQLVNQALGDTNLERCPIVHEAGKWFVLLPAALSVAVRRHVLEWMVSRGYESSFDSQMVLEYRDFFTKFPILGTPLPVEAVMMSKHFQVKSILEFAKKIDTGRYLHVIAVVDSIEAYPKHGFSLPDPNVSELSDLIDRQIEKARSFFTKQKGFKQGLTFLVSCGYGRPSIFRPPEEMPEWWVEFVSAPDLETLSWIPESSSLFLWKLLDNVRFLAEHGISIGNINGLLNLYGWSKDTKHLILPSEVEFGAGPIEISIPTDCLAEVRRKIRQGLDAHVLPHPNGSFVRVSREAADSFFPDEAEKPKYVSIDSALSGELRGAWVGKKSIWWVEAKSVATGLSRDIVFRVWDAVINWLDKAVPVLEGFLSDQTDPIVLITLDFTMAHQEQVDPIPEQQLRSCLSVTADQEKGTICIVFRDPFFAGFREPKNTAERTIIRAIVEGMLKLSAGIINDKTLDLLVNEIVPNEDARYVHFFEGVHFRDYIQQYDRPIKLFIDNADEARSKLGLGWLVQTHVRGVIFTKAHDSVSFLNRVVAAIAERMCGQLKKLNRKDLVEKALRHIEGVEADKKRWKRTARAVFALREDKASAKEVATKQLSRCNAAEIALRLVIEMALSECPLESGELVGELDLTPLMSNALMMFHLGGCSDAINKGVMEPEVRVAANGDVLTHIGFQDEIVEPLGRHFGSTQLDYEVSRYEKHFKQFDPVPTVKGRFPDKFLSAFETEFGFSVDALRSVREALENLAIENEKCVFEVRKDEILAYCGKSELATPKVAEIVLDRFELWPRESWDTTPEKGFVKKDLYPWRFGRKLSLMRRPIVRLEDCGSPLYVISPGLLGVGIVYTLSRYYEGIEEVLDCRTDEMKRWIDDETNRRGHEFAKEVYDTLRALGFEARLEIKMTALLNDKLDKDYGDVDVLAWKLGEDAVLAIECKELRFAKTSSEIAEQLNQFSGQVLPSGKRDKLLRHLDRCRLLSERISRVAKTIGIEDRDISIKAVICFSKPVPMQYIAKRFPDVSFLTIDNLTKNIVNLN